MPIESVRRITLICTTHRELGLCNESTLLQILEAINPDVIFEELSPSDLASFYRERTRYTLETRAISDYLKGRPARQVAVDEYALPENFRSDLDALFDYAESSSNEYCDAVNELDSSSFHGGFSYLNSQDFAVLRRKADDALDKAITASGRKDLSEIYSTWDLFLRERNASMVRNIYDYCRENPCADGVFLVGAAHRTSLVGCIESAIKLEPDLVTWNIAKVPARTSSRSTR